MEYADPSNLTKLLQGKIALVTGASRGIGRAAAIALGAAGAHVVCVARTVGGLEETDDAIVKAGGSATLVPLNLKDVAAIDRLGASLFERWGKLDAFLGNAGVLGTLTPLTHLEPKDFADLLDINVTANWRLIRSLDPLLRLSEGGRVLFLTSGAARKHTPYWGGYAMSKAALESLALTYAAECEGGGKVKVNLLNPGPIRTAMRAKAMPGENPSALKRPEELTPLIVELLSTSNSKNGQLVNFQS
jgi:NAD(P)-dependent dehydrogenase (short-subunit alcohol dehydrogenase family)